MLTKRTKTVWTVLLSVLFVAVLAGIVAVLSRTVGGVTAFRFPGASIAVAGGSAEKSLHQSVSVTPNQVFDFSVPLGELTVLPASGKQVEVDASVQVIGTAGTPLASARNQIALTSTSDQGGKHMTLSYPNGTLKSATITIYVPNGARLQVEDTLGEIRVQGGAYKDLTLHANLGAINVSAAVSQSLSVQANMGAITYTGPLALQNTFVNNMGSITVSDTKRQAVQYHLSTSMGQSTVNVPSASVSASGNQLSDTVSGPGPQAMLSCTDNLGSIHFQGV